MQPSSIETNEITDVVPEDDEIKYFKFEDEFKDSLDMFTIPYTGEGDVIRGSISFNPPVTDSEHIIEKDGIGKVVTTSGGVLLGKMSFQMTADTFDVSWFQLVEDSDSSLQTGIKINIDGTNYYEAQSTFRFTDRTASKDASLSNLVVSSGTVDETNPDNSTYKEYDLTPTFDKDTLNYEIELLEYVDTLNIKATPNDENSTMKIKVPTRDDDNNLIYDTDGTTIIYEEKELQSDTPLEVTINKLGEPDTNITIIVTAEDGKTINNYELVIKRPYGIIKGSIITSNTNDIHLADLKLYDSTIGFDWNNMIDHDELEEVEMATKGRTNEDGTYEVYIIPGTYDLLIDKPGYLDYITLQIPIVEGKTIELNEIELMPGDVNKDGLVELEDLGFINDNYDAMLDDDTGMYEERFDFTGDGLVDMEDLGLINDNYETERTIEIYK